jgi:hypothetical protein
MIIGCHVFGRCWFGELRWGFCVFGLLVLLVLFVFLLLFCALHVTDRWSPYISLIPVRFDSLLLLLSLSFDNAIFQFFAPHTHLCLSDEIRRLPFLRLESQTL